MKKKALFLSLLLVILLSACGAAVMTPAANFDMSSRDFIGVAGNAEVESFALQAEAPAAAPAEKAADGSEPSIHLAGPSDRIVLYDASLTLVVNDPSDAASKIADMAFAKGGWVVNSNITQSVYGSNGEKYYAGEISIRVPTESEDTLKAALAEIEALAVEVKSRTTTGRDVTAEYTDTQSRLRNLRASEQRLLEIMEGATDTEAVLAVETQLSQVTSEIEVLEGQIQYYETASKNSLVTIYLQPYIPSQPIDIAGWHPEGVAKEAVEDLIHSLQNLVDFLIRLGICGLPALAVIVLFVMPIFLISRSIYRRYRKTHPTA
jgi:hypothetical protein